MEYYQGMTLPIVGDRIVSPFDNAIAVTKSTEFMLMID
jgi:hypothetical protein